MRNPCRTCGSLDHCSGDCPKRPRSGKHSPRPLLGFDCESVAGVGIVLFVASGADRRATFVYDAGGMSLDTVLEWMIQAGAGRLNFGFYFDYDVNQLVALLPDPHQAQLAARGRVRCGRWRLNHTPGKRFSVTDCDSERSVTIWDCSGWAQCSFAKLTQDWQLGSETERELIKRMKERREDFANATRAELVEYTTLECALLSEWTARLLQLHADCGIHLRAYSGPGSTAGAMIRQRGWKPPAVPDRVQEIAESAFYGGRSEISSIGPIAGPIYSYDINSAYPSAIADLPELSGARWHRVRRYDPSWWGFYRVRWTQPKRACWGFFPVRGAKLPTGRRSVSLLYPREGDGWFHSAEVAAALSTGEGTIEVIDGWIVEPRGRPFEWIRETTTERLKYKAAGDARAFPLKVGCNSVYGKLAQHSGAHPLQCLCYAAAVTATTRGELLKMAVRHQHDVILLATDGILSTVPLDCEVGPHLGEWEYTTHPDAWLLQAGVYWAGGKKRTRGIDARGLSKDAVETVWAKRKTRAQIELAARRVLSYRLCAAQHKLALTGTWQDSTRTVRFAPDPRRRSYRWEGLRLRTLPARVADYRAAAILDQLAMDVDAAEGRYDNYEATPDWALYES